MPRPIPFPATLRLARRIVLAAGVLMLATEPAHAACSWVDSITGWDGSLSWSYSHQATWSNPPLTHSGQTRDRLSATFDLDTVVPGYAQGPMEGTMRSFDRVDTDSGVGLPVWVETEANGPIDAYAPPPPQVLLFLDSQMCTYTFIYGPELAANGTSRVKSGSAAPTSSPTIMEPGGIVVPPQIPIPEAPAPLSFSGQVDAVTLPPLPPISDPYYVPIGAAYDSAEFLGEEQLGNASVQWSFSPKGSQQPPNDGCAGATLLNGIVQDSTFATSPATDPTPSCGGGDHSVWFLVQADDSGRAAIATTGSDYGTIVSVWPMSEACGAITTQIACGAASTSFATEPGATYRVQIASSTGSGGSLVAVANLPEPASAAVPAAFLTLAWLRRRRCSRPWRPTDSCGVRRS